MGFQTGLSGLNAASKNLDVIGNNVANSSTVGFKSGQAQFADVFAASLSGGGASQIGIGTKLSTVAQQFTQGNITSTNNPLDVAINGKGFFVLGNGGAQTYSRNGQFQLDKNGNIVTSNGLKLQGYQVDSNGVVTGAMGSLLISTASQPPEPTGGAAQYAATPVTYSSGTGVKIVVNLDSRSTPIDSTATPFSPTNPASYTKSTSFQIFDSLGNAHTLTEYFVAGGAVPATPGTWNVYATVDGTQTGVTPQGSPLLFDTSGKLVAATVPFQVAVDLDAVAGAQTTPTTNNAAQTLSFNVDFTNSTQFGSLYAITSATQDGYAPGELASFNIGQDGTLQGRYTNGQARNMGQLALANFANPQGLQQLGDNQWAESPGSGAALLGQPGSAGLGVLQSSATEDSNVDLTAELVNMIVAQRAYQANAQTIKTQDAIQQTLMNLR